MQLRQPSHPTRGIPVAINCLTILLKEPVVRSSFVKADGVKLLVPLIVPASTQQSMQVPQYLQQLLLASPDNQNIHPVVKSSHN